MKTILVLGTNAGQADLIRHMKARGDWRVVGVSPLKGEPGQAFCDAVEPVDVTDLDALEAVAQRQRADLVYSVSSDIAIAAAVALSERLGLPHFHHSAFVALLDDKAALRGFLNARGLGPVPFRQVRGAAELAGWNHFPTIVKPTDAQGQRGMALVTDAAALAAAVGAACAASRSGRAIVEGFLDGVELSCNVLCCGGEMKLQVLSERLVHGADALGVPRGHLIPVRHVPAAAQAEALRLVAAITAAFGTPDGPLYFQLIVTPDGPRVVEIAPRLDGCHMWRLIRAAEGADLLAMAIDCLTGAAPVPKLPALAPESAGGRDMELMFQQQPPGTGFDPAAFPVPEGALHHEYRYAPGETVRAVNGTLEVVGYYVRASQAPGPGQGPGRGRRRGAGRAQGSAQGSAQ